MEFVSSEWAILGVAGFVVFLCLIFAVLDIINAYARIRDDDTEFY